MIQEDDTIADESEEIKFFEDDDDDGLQKLNTGEEPSSASDSRLVLPAAPPSPAGLLISLISSLLENYSDLFSDMPSVGGWQIFGFLLQKMHPNALDLQALHSLDNLATVLFNSGTYKSKCSIDKHSSLLLII